MKAIEVAAKGAMTFGVVLAIQGLCSVAFAQTVYKTVDDEGNVAYTDRPPMIPGAEMVRGLDISPTDNNFLDESEKQQAADHVAQDIRIQFEQEKASEDAQMAAAQNEQRVANCRSANERLKKYSESQRLYRTTASGEREYLDSNELDAARSKAARDVVEWCG